MKRREGGKSLQRLLQMISAVSTSAYVHSAETVLGDGERERRKGNSTGATKRVVMCNTSESLHHQLKEG